jgi:superfamily I DNA/RNA helicase
LRSTMIYGPPGTGKTTELLRLLEEAVTRTERSRIGYLSFTKAAAAEALGRMGLKSSPNVSTLHSLAYRLLQISKQQVVTPERLVAWSSGIGIPMTGATYDSERDLSVGDELHAIYQLSGARQTDPDEEYLGSNQPGSYKLYKFFWRAYESWLRGSSFVDFNDMLVRFCEKAPPSNIEVLFIDEAQDLSNLQWGMIMTLIERSAKIKEIYIAGDDDQSIYEWGGANPHGMKQFEQDFTSDRRILSQSYRLPFSIHRLADSVISRVQNRVPKAFRPRDADGKVEWHSFPQSVKIDEKIDTLLLYRNHANRKELESILLERAIPYDVLGGKPAPLFSRYAYAIRTFLALQKGHDVDIRAMESLKKLSARPYPEALKEKWQNIIIMPSEYAGYLSKVGVDVVPRVRLGSIHSAKGREAQHVVLLTAQTTRTTESCITNPDAEARVWYVGVTRASERLDIVEGHNGYPI